KLIETADIVAESFKPGYMDELGIGYSDIKKLKENIIWASVTPFGLEGPYRDYKDSDLVVMGMTGTMYQTGERDEAPLHISMPQACLHAGADAAVGCMMAYYYREKTGKGQLVDVSLQQSAGWFQANAIPMYELSGGILRRAGAFRVGMSKDVGQRQVWPCKDSYVFFNVIGGKQGAKLLRSLTEWMDIEGMATEYLLGKDWDNFDMFSVSREEMMEIQEAIGTFFKTHTSKELMEGAVPRQISIGPLSSMEDLINDEGLNGRDFWKKIDHPELGVTLPYPRQFVQSSAEDFSTRFRAPLIGEHNQEIYSGLGLSDNEIIILKQAGII
ncbi:CaiB/BaiF CoA transferase family protein, partial [Chloroflexota bacterium]